MKRFPILAAAAVVAAAAFLATRPVLAGDPAPSAAASEPAKAAPAETPKTETPKAEAAKPETKTPSPIASMMKWVGHEVAPKLAMACPSTAEGEAAWRGWFTGGASVPLAGLRDAMVADGWTADRFVTFFKEMVAAQKASGGPCAGECHDADGKGKCGGDCAGKCEGGHCGEKCGGDCAGKCPHAKGDAAKPDAPKSEPSKPTETTPKP